ncbi:unnamed protein product [Brugia timori]|uniref:DUF5110 domain-containing protein n=1 Tax=Brugia timori TaxID=42155 RepID=A0A0R3Q3P9_9BILA|nr:unnamed protein product [Brugia timori]
MSICVANPSLDLDEKVIFQDHITDVKYIHHFPHSYCSYKYNDESTISVDQKNAYTFPHDSYICIKGYFENPGSAYFLGYNGILHLFKEIIYKINGVEIERVSNPGIATAIRRILLTTSQNETYYKCFGFSNESTHAYSNVEVPIDAENGVYHFYIELPLHIIFSSVEDYRKILINARQEIIFRRDVNDKNVFLLTEAAKANNRDAKFIIESIDWKLPYLEVSDILKNHYLKMLKNDTPLLMPFRKWEFFENTALPRTNSCNWNIKMVNNTDRLLWFGLTFHINKRYSYTESMRAFQSAGLKNLKVFINSKYYPYDNQNSEYWHYDAFYQELSKFERLYNSKYSSLPAAPFLKKDYFENHFPIFLINLSYRDTSVKTGVSDLKVYFETSTIIPENTIAYGFLISETVYQTKPLSELTTQVL